MQEVKKYNEVELIFLLKNRDQTAFAYLYDNYSAALRGVIYKMLENRELSEDVLQKAFIKLGNNFSNYDSDTGRLFTLVLNITRNLKSYTIGVKGYQKKSKIHN